MNGHQRQREQSGRMIEDALLELMREKAFEQITVSEIAARADVGRRTFYRLYKGKEEVLRGRIDKLSKAYRNSHSPLKSYDIARISKEYFAFWYQYRDLLLLMYRSGLEHMLYYEISRVSTEIIKSRIDDEAQKEGRALEYFADYSAGGFILLLHRWIADGMREAPGQYAEAVSKSLLRFIRNGEA